MYYSWLKKYNHLYKDTQLDASLVDDFTDESMSAAKDFQRITRRNNKEVKSNDNEDEQSDESDEDHLIKVLNSSKFEPYKSNDEEVTHDQTTMFFNKYCENTDIPSAANRLADAIVDYEIAQMIPIINEDDFEVDDEFISEEEF